MTRIITLTCVTALIAATHAAYAKGKSKSKAIRGWGTFVDPAGDCRVTEKNGRITFTVPGTHHNLNPLPKFNNTDGPRLLQRVEGDFTIEVTVLPFPIPKRGTSNNRGGHSYCAAGLLVWQDGKNLVRWFRAANGDRGDVFRHPESYKNGRFRGAYYARGLKNRDRRISNKELAYMRLVRRGNRFTFYRSNDGKTWEAFVYSPYLKLNNTLHVGVGAVNSAKAEFSPRLDGFKLTVHRK